MPVTVRDGGNRGAYVRLTAAPQTREERCQVASVDRSMRLAARGGLILGQ